MNTLVSACITSRRLFASAATLALICVVHLTVTAQLAHEVRIDEAQLTFYLPFGYESDKKLDAVTQADYPEEQDPGISGYSSRRFDALTLPGTPALVKSVGVRRFSSPGGSVLYVEVFRGHKFSLDETREFFNLLRAANTSERLDTCFISTHTITISFQRINESGVRGYFESRHHVTFAADGFILLSLFNTFYAGKVSALKDVYDLWRKNESDILGSMEFDAGFSFEANASTTQHPPTEPTEPGDTNEHRTRNQLPNSESKQIPSLGARLVYYAARAVPSGIIFLLGVISFYFGLRRFRSMANLSVKHLAIIFTGFWILSASFGILGGDDSAPVPTRIALVLLAVGIVFLGVSFVFRRKQDS